MELDNFDKEFVMAMFLDTDDIHNMNRLVVALANVVVENNENVIMITHILKDENSFIKLQDSSRDSPVGVRRKRNTTYESLLTSYSDGEYYERFKMRKSTVQALINYLSDFISPSNIQVDKKVHIFLSLITSDASYSDVAAIFNMHKSSVSYIFHEIATLLTEHRYDFISWPSLEEQHINRIKVSSIFNFPNCVGFIDACSFKIGAKKSKNGRMEQIYLQAVCDPSLSFIDIYISEIGVTKKSKVFKASPLSRELKNFVTFENHILGDSEYKLKKNLITPFTSEEILTPEEMKFNEIHWKVRSYIGHAFELMKERFTKLHHIDVIKPDSVYAVVCAACVLHNFVIFHEGGPVIKEERVACDEGVIIDMTVVSTAKEKREFLCNFINEIDSMTE